LPRGAVFFNPSSGQKLAASELAALKEAVGKADLEVVELSRDLDSIQAVRERLNRGTRLFIAGGGDGTVNSLVQALVNTDAKFAVLPIGTYNHFAKDAGIPIDWREALEIALNGRVRQVDTARINDRFFVNNVSLGLYPELVARREARGRDYPKWKARLWAAYGTLRMYPSVTLGIESAHHQEVIRTHVFMISNNSYDLSRIGIEASRDTLQAGRLSVYWLPHLPRIALMKFVAHYLAGRVRGTPGFRSFFTQRMKAQSSRPTLKVGIDGEVFTMQTPLVVTSVPQSLLVKVPADVIR
jgi:diacylglycerol kinase family enzyme